MKWSYMKIAGFMVCVILAGTVLFAEQSNADLRNEVTYVAIPMKMFKMLTEKPKKPEAPKFYTYQNGKLEECTTNYGKEIGEETAKCKQKGHFRGNFNRGFNKKQGDTVLLTIEQLDTLKKQKMEQELKAINSAKELSQDSKIVNAKINGKDVKIAMMNPMIQPGFNHNMMPKCHQMGPHCMNPMIQPGFNNMSRGHIVRIR